MYKCLFSFSCILLYAFSSVAQVATNPHGLENTGKAPVYGTVSAFYKHMAATHKNIEMATVGTTDTDDSLLVVYYSADGRFDISQWKKAGKLILLINNGIHAGEPDGIVASMQLLWDIAEKKVTVPPNVVLA